MTDDEKNEAVALKLGWKLLSPAGVGLALWKSPTRRYDSRDDSGVGVYEHVVLPAYCTDIKAAWEIVEYLNQKYYAVKIVSMPMIGHCSINKNGEEPLSIENADTAPMAICLAFLKLES